jgi:hypothetical protein
MGVKISFGVKFLAENGVKFLRNWELKLHLELNILQKVELILRDRR